MAIRALLITAQKIKDDYSELLFDAAAGLRVAEGKPVSQSNEPSVAVWLGENRYEVDGVCCTVNNGSQAEVMEAAVNLGTFDDEGLVKESGITHAAKVLRTIASGSHPLSSFIYCPGGKGKGGYRVEIRKMNSQVDA